MSPFEFLKEECASVRATLSETLRHDYGPERSRDYFDECGIRLDAIEQAVTEAPGMDRTTIAAHMRSLSSLGSRISLIERSHLGEFSWPFAEIIRAIAKALFVEKSLFGKEGLEGDLAEQGLEVDLEPIVHVIAEGMDYQIVDDDQPRSGLRRIVIVAFPRQLKHHVLLHPIFGHELGHTAISAEGPGFAIRTRILPILCEGPLQDEQQALQWLKSADAPQSTRDELAKLPEFKFSSAAVSNWRIEIVCDLFGLMLFGPSFVAAHRTIIEALCAKPDTFDLESSSHPPYPVRQKILATAIRILGWDIPVTKPKDGAAHDGERRFLSYVTESVGDEWFARLLPEDLIRRTIEVLGDILEPYPNLGFHRPTRETLMALIKRLGLQRPPIHQTLNEAGEARNFSVPSYHCLYAGWSFWHGIEKFPVPDGADRTLTFLEVNRLCDHAILQQQAIDLVNSKPEQDS